MGTLREPILDASPDVFWFADSRRTQMAATSKRGRLPLAATCVAMVFAIGATVWPQPSALSIVLTGQSMTRSDIRVTEPSAVSTIAAMLKGDVVFTNYEGAVAEPG